MAPAGLWIDTDIALGAAKGDVDDGWAMAALSSGGDHSWASSQSWVWWKSAVIQPWT